MNDGFIWNKKHSEQYGIVCSELPGKGAAERNIDKVEVPGRDGFLTVDHGTYKGDVKQVTFHLLDESSVDKVQSWLCGSGEIIFSNFPDRYYKAIVLSKIELTQVIPVLHKGIIQFDCQPFGYLLSGTETFELTKSGNVFNPGNVKSKPHLKIFASGDITLKVNEEPLRIQGVQTYVEVDGKMDSIYKNTVSWENKAIGDTPMLLPGNNTISWTGSISRIEITPHWRCL